MHNYPGNVQIDGFSRFEKLKNFDFQGFSDVRKGFSGHLLLPCLNIAQKGGVMPKNKT
jgi:hypothetical protein